MKRPTLAGRLFRAPIRALARLDAESAVFVLFLVLLTVGMLRHELWRDEIRAWVIANRSTSLADLFRNLRFEGHPALWFLILRGLGWLGGGLVSMQAFHMATAAAAAWVVLRYAPFRLLDRVLLVFGYFMLYEYGVISRNYSTGVLLLFVVCALLSAGADLLALSPALFLLAQTNVFGLVFAGALLFHLAGDDRFMKDAGKRPWRFQAGLAVVAAGLAISAIWIRPAPGHAMYAEWHTALEWERAVATLSAFWNAWVPIPALKLAFWNTNIVSSPAVRAAGALVFLAVFAAWFRRRLPVLVFFLSTCSAFLLLFYVKVPGYMRHHGHLFLALVVSAWLMARGRGGTVPRWAGVLFTAILAAGTLGAGVAWVQDVRHPFSQMEAAAKVIRGRSLDRLPVLGDKEYATGPLSGLLGKEIFILAQDRFAWFTAWEGRQYTGRTGAEGVLAKARKLAGEKRAAVLVMNDGRLEKHVDRKREKRGAARSGKGFTLRKVAYLGPSIVEDESYNIYLLKLPRKRKKQTN